MQDDADHIMINHFAIDQSAVVYAHRCAISHSGFQIFLPAPLFFRPLYFLYYQIVINFMRNFKIRSGCSTIFAINS